MANDAVLGVTIKAIGDFSDVVSNVGSVQKALTKLKLPDKLGDNLSKNIGNFYKEYEKYQKKIAEGINTQGDQNAVNKSLNSMLNSYEKIINEFSKLSKQDFKDIFNLDEGVFASVQKRIKDIQTEIKKIKIDPKQLLGPMEEITKLTKAKAVSGSGKGVDKIQAGIDANDFSIMKQGLIELETYYDRFSSKMSDTKRLAMADEIDKLKKPIEDAINASDRLEKEAKELDKQFNDIGSGASRELGDVTAALDKTKVGAENVVVELKRIHSEEFSFNREAQNIDRQIQSYFGLSQMIRKVGDIARNAFATVKDLDKAMTETAVVTNFDVGDMWDMLPTYTQQANQLGSTIKDVYEAATLYYQQGLNTNQAMGLANETLKMARIAGLDATEATNMMTAALRGFNMEVNQMSAQKINDIYSELAAITASDTKEIGSAMERTASIANAANMEFATTSAFLAQMIETTREAPENLGTAMKTIVARFQEMKQDPTKLIDSEGVAMDVNKVDKALKTIGVSLTNTKGEFRDLDDVFLDISAKWNSLSQGQQRYIATIAAGSRQQSRFIAMMSNYERTMELVDAANNSAGASQRQFEKTLDSMEAKLNKLKNAWDQFTMGLMNNQILKTSVDLLTGAFTIVNKLIDTLGSIPTKPFEGITKSALTLIATLSMLQLGKKSSRGLVMGAASWWQKGKIGADGNPMDGGFLKGFAQGWGSPKNAAALAKQSKYGDAIKASIISARIPQTIQGEFQKGKVLATAAFNTGTQLIALNNIINTSAWDSEAKALGIRILQEIEAEIEKGKISPNALLPTFNYRFAQEHGNTENWIGKNQLTDEAGKVEQLGNEFNGLGSKITKAGTSLQAFGATMQGTPLEPFGNALIRIGNLLVNTGDLAISAGKKLKTAWKAAQDAKKDGATNAGAIGAFFKSFTKIPAQVLIILAIVAAMGALIHHVATQGKRDLEAAENAAAAASEAYDSAKQEASELADAIDKIHEADSAFDGLVVGTAAFNEQLVTANDQIMELIKKYPMLNDYLTTDKNGVMHISEEGLTAVKEYQKQRQANASALNILQTNDLRTEETKQQIEALRKKDKGRSEYSADKQQNKDEIELLEKRIKAEDQAAKLSAVNTALVGKEISNREKVSTILADQYDMRKSMVQLEGDKHDKRQQYAEFYGYSYNRSTKKMTDVEGNEVEFDDKVIEDALKDITVLADFEVNAGAVDTAIASIDKKFSKQFSGDNSFFSDILSDNIETNEDLLRDVLQNPNKLENAVSELSEKEIAAVLGVSADMVAEAPDKYKDELTDKLVDKAKNIVESQSEAWGELGAMIARSEGMRAEAILDGRESSTNLIQQQLTEYTAEQRDLMVSIGKSLESGAGVESMKSFIRNASDIYREGTEETINELNGIIEGVNWDSPTARLKAYKDLTSSTTPEIQKMGQELLESTDSANLLGEAFEEFYNSNDWAELSENMDNFVDSTGKVNAVGVEEMAKQCNSLNNLLDTGAISAGGVAAAINALGTNGELTLLDLNSAVLQLLSTFGQLDNIIGQAHQSIENFDWGIDTGESADFVKESAEKWNELYEGGEVGNPQLEAYAKYILGEENYIKKLNKNHGDLQATMDEVSKYVNEYADGFDKAWDSLANGDWQGKVPKELQDLNISFGYNENGKWEWDPGSATTEQLSEWLQAVKGIGPEMAAAMIEDWQNYSPDFRAERQKNDFYAGLDNYIAQRSGDNGVTITTGELDTIAAATGESVDDVKAAIIETAEANGQKITEIDNTVEGITSEELNTQYNKAKTGDANQSWIQGLIKTGSGDEKQIDASQAITQAIGDGFTQAQAETMAYDELSKAVAEGTDVWYKDKLLTPEDLASFDSFKTAIEDFENSSQWVEVGKAIAEGVVSYIEGKDNPKDTTDNSSNKNEEPTPKVVKPSQKESRYTDTGTGGKESYTNSYSKAEEQQYSRGIVAAIKELIPPLKENNEPTELTPAQYQKMYGTSNPNAPEDKTSESNDNLQDAASKLQEGGMQIETAATKLETGASKVENAASKLETAASNLSKPQELNSKNSTVPNGVTVPGVGFVSSDTQPTNGNISIETSEADTKVTALQTKLKELNDLVSQGNTYKLNISGAKDIKAAASAAKTLTQNAGTQTIKVKTGKADTSSVDAAKKTINGTESKIKVGATVDSAIAAARRAQRTINDMSATIDVSINQTGNRTVNIVVKKSGKTVGTTNEQLAKGKNNHGIVAPPSFGSAARGKYGQVGPKGKGGLTLTGELGYEVAWLPDENRSMILGANGPQMIDLPGNAVVWDHEQSKKIVKQKAIPAGSHSSSTRPGNNSNGGGGGGSSTKNKGNSSQSITDKKVKSTIDTVAKQLIRTSVWWENMGRRVDAVQQRADKNQKTYEKYLSTIQATLTKTGTTGQGNAFISNTNKTIDLYKAELKRANKDLNNYLNGTAKQQKAANTKKKKDDKKANKKAYLKDRGGAIQISYEKGKGKKKKTKNAIVATSKYLKEQDGTLVIDEKRLKRVKNKSKRNAIAEELNKEVNDRLSKKRTAEENIAKAQEALDNFSKKLYDTFFGWEIELTKIRNLTQQIEVLNSKISRKNAMEELLKAQIRSGLVDTEQVAGQSLQNFNNQLQLEQETMTKRRKAITQSNIDLQNKATGKDIQEAIETVTYNLRHATSETDKKGFREALKELKNKRDVYNTTLDYADFNRRTDGTYDVEFDTASFERDKLEGKISSDMGAAVQNFVKEIEEGSANLDGLYQSQTEGLGEFYIKANDLNDQWVDIESQLVDINEEANQKELEQMKKLSDSIKKSMDDLLDEVKRKLDERRKQEDNAKTERDISQKQQRLAALRADTAGGHAVEIAQLEKEIAEAQQSYQRTLEDQLLEKMQNQAEEASKQRERQIELQEELATSVNNIKDVTKWMAAPKEWKEQIWERYKTAHNYDTAAPEQKASIARDFAEFYANLLNNREEYKAVKKVIDEEQPEAVKQKESENLSLTTDEKKIKEEEEKKMAAKLKTSPKVSTPTPAAVAKTSTTKEAKKDAYNEIVKRVSKNPKNFSIAELGYVKHWAELAGIGPRTYLKDLAKTNLSWQQIIRTAVQMGFKKKRLIVSFNSSEFKKGYNALYGKNAYENAIKQGILAKPYAYATGGLATHTGPAWLDGTPSKPELVLNAKDTKNFIALKDVLSRAIGSTSQIENTYGGDATYEININVDHLNNDYDVDKVVERVKKKIVQDSGYRNVTQVRKFR